MRNGYFDVPVTSRAAQAELERQRARRFTAARKRTSDYTSERSFGTPGTEENPSVGEGPRGVSVSLDGT